MFKKPPECVEKFEFVPIPVRNPLVRFFGGLKFGLTVLFLLIIASSIGELLPQDQQNNLAFRLVFQTWWYRMLLLTLGINLILNTYMTYVEDTYPQFLPIFRNRPDNYKLLKINHKAQIKGTEGGNLPQTLASVFHGRGYRCFYDGEAFYGHRGLIARFGSTLTHLGLITIIAGALAESYFKTEGTVALIEGETIDRYSLLDELPFQPSQRLGFSVTLHDFEFTEYPGTRGNNELGIASKYKSTMTWSGASERPVHDFVRVNHRIKYGGWTFHQNSYLQLTEGDTHPRYFAAITESLPDGGKKTYRLETYLSPDNRSHEREILSLPGHDDRFLIVEPDSSGRGMIWTVASQREVLARGVKSIFGDLRIELLEFYPDLAVSNDRGVFNQSSELRHPAAYVEITSDNKVAYRAWIFPETESGGHAHEDNESLISVVMIDFEYRPMPAGGGIPDGETGGPIEARTSVTVALRNQETGAPMSDLYKLTKGESVSLIGEIDKRMEIAGDYELEVFQRIPSFATFLSISKNPGIPIVWLGAILASGGPVLAFFVSRRRVWAFVDSKKKALWIGGESRYSREALEDEIADAARTFSKAAGVKLSPPPNFTTSGENKQRLSQYM